jgi:predicted dehydrogenase
VTERLRVAVVGTGAWWGREHARVLSQHQDVELCAVVGRSSAKATQRAAGFGTTPYVDLDEMLATEMPDLASLCLPNEGHFDTTLRVLLDEAERRDLFFAINFNHRYARPVQMARTRSRPARSGTSRSRRGASAARSAPARTRTPTSSRRSATASTCGYTTLVVALTFESGAVGALVGTYDSSYAYPETHYVEVNGSAGRVQITDTVKRFTRSVAGSELREVWESGYFNDRDRDFDHLFEAHLDDIVIALRRSEPPPIHARAGRRALLVARACIQSPHR